MPTIKVQSLDEILASLKNKAMKEIIDEFKNLLKDGLSDSTTFIKESAENANRWLTMLGNKQLKHDEVLYLLKQQKKRAQIFANTQKITVMAKVQKLTYKLLDIAIDVLAGAIAIA